jgi:hypothetical protein
LPLVAVSKPATKLSSLKTSLLLGGSLTLDFPLLRLG